MWNSFYKPQRTATDQRQYPLLTVVLQMKIRFLSHSLCIFLSLSLSFFCWNVCTCMFTHASSFNFFHYYWNAPAACLSLRCILRDDLVAYQIFLFLFFFTSRVKFLYGQKINFSYCVILPVHFSKQGRETLINIIKCIDLLRACKV